jgi:NAD(P)-dependent dehydrogenase (short-subunit alcohol dehydrogenase family)
MNEEYAAKAVVITGASTGIGKACALRLDEKGVRVFAGVRNEPDGASLKQNASDRLTPVLIDVTIPDTIASARRAIADAVSRDGLAGLVNNAGIYLGGPLEFSSIDEMRKEFEVNLFGAIAVAQAFLPLLRTGRGRIVNMSSISGMIALPFFGPYAASKFALEAISDSWRVELRPWGISVAVVEPGDVDTPIREKVIATLRKARQAFPPEVHELYGPILGLSERQQRRGIPAERVAEVVEHALFARRPKRRYTVGTDAKIVSALRKLPVGFRDWLIARQFPTYGQPLSNTDPEPGNRRSSRKS